MRIFCAGFTRTVLALPDKAGRPIESGRGVRILVPTLGLWPGQDVEITAVGAARFAGCRDIQKDTRVLSPKWHVWCWAM